MSTVSIRNLDTSVYFIADGDLGPDTYIKIGKSNDPIYRLSSLQTGNPRKLRIICTFRERFLRSNEDLKIDELYFHRLFKQERIEGTEWFRWSPYLERGIWYLRAHGSELGNQDDLYKFEKAVKGEVNQLEQHFIFIEWLKARAGESIRNLGAWSLEELKT